MSEPTPFPDPSNVKPWYLRNITEALYLADDGNVTVRTNAGNISIGNITIENVGITSLGNVDISQSTLPVTIENIPDITGNIDINTMPPITGDITGNVNIVNTTPIPVEGNVSITGNTSVSLPSTNYDSFGRLRISNPYTLFDSHNKYYDQEQFFSDITNGSVSYDQFSSTFLLSLNGAGSIIRETTKTFVYQPGKSLLILNTFAMNSLTPGLTQRVGYHGEDNGVYFEVNGNTVNMVIRSSSSGSLVEDRVSQSNWNGDRLDGTGPSGIILDPSLTQIFWTDIEWLGVGSVRTGFVINGVFIVCHTFHHANITGNTTTYMGTAVLPVRYEISSTGPLGTLRQICSTVISEGGYSMTGIPSGIGHDLSTPVRLPNDSSFKPLISIRLKSSAPDAIILPTDFTIVPVDQAVIKYRVYTRAITSGGTWVSAGSNSSVEYNLAPTSLVSGQKTVSSFLVSNNQSVNVPQDQRFDFSEQLERNTFTNTMYEYVIMAATLGTNIDVYSSINWQEIT